MEIYELENFLAVVREGTISGAAQSLHLSQPSLSRQMQELEEEVGRKLFERGNRRITLTPEGMILEKRASEILMLLRKTEGEIRSSRDEISGDIYIGAAETRAVHFLTAAAAAVRSESPHVRFHIASGDTNDTLFQLEHGLINFALLFGPVDSKRYHSIQLPVSDRWIALMRRENPLSGRESLSLKEDLKDEPLIISRLSLGSSQYGIDFSTLNIAGTYSLAHNAAYMVEDGLGTALCFDSIVNLNGSTKLCAVPLSDMELTIPPVLLWKKYQTLSSAEDAFLSKMEEAAGIC